MNKNKFNNFISLAAIVIVLFACSNDPSITTEIYTFDSPLDDGTNVKTYLGDVGQALPINIRKSSSYNYVDDPPIDVRYEVVSGGGSVASPKQTFDSKTGIKLSNQWILGNKPTEQELVVKFYLANGNYLTSLSLFAWAMQANRWNTVSYNNRTPPLYISAMVRDMVNDRTYIIRDGQIFLQGAGFNEWISQYISAQEIFVDSKGTIFRYDYNYLSKKLNGDQGFDACPHPFSTGSFSLWLTNNDVFFAQQNVQMKCSKDGCQTWTECNLYFSEAQLGVYSLPDGSFVSMGNSEKAPFYHSDDGINWSKTGEAGEKMSLMTVNNKGDMLMLHAVDSQMELYKSTDRGITRTKVKTIPLSFAPQSLYAEHYGNDCYLTIHGSGVFKTSDFETFDEIVDDDNAYETYIDSRGDIYVMKLGTYNSQGSMSVWRAAD